MNGEDRPVVAGIAGTHLPDEVVAHAARESLLRGRPLRLVHVYALPPATSDEAAHGATAAAKRAHRDAVSKLDAQRSAVGQLLPGARVELVVRSGRRIEVLLQEARYAELLVVGAGAGWQRGESSGSLAVQVASHTTQPVLVVRGSRGAGRPPEARVVVGVTAAPTVGALLGAAFEEANLRRLDLQVIHAEGTDGHHGCEPGGERLLAEALAGWRQKYPEVAVEQRLSPANPAAALVEASQSADLLVVGDRGSGGFERLRLGSVTDAALRHAGCPVLVVPSRPTDYLE